MVSNYNIPSLHNLYLEDKLDVGVECLGLVAFPRRAVVHGVDLWSRVNHVEVGGAWI